MASTAAASGAPGNSTAALTGWQQRSSQFFSLLILFAFPIFSVPCQKGICSSPLDVIVTQLYVKNMVSEDVIKTALYPAAMMVKMEVLMGDDPQSFSLPEWDGILTSWNLTARIVEKGGADHVPFSFVPKVFTMFDQSQKAPNWEFVSACAVCLTGALLSLVGPSKFSMWGILLVLWYIFIEGGKNEEVHVLPMYMVAFICSLGWINFKDFFTLPKERSEPAKPAAPKVKVEFKKRQ